MAKRPQQRCAFDGDFHFLIRLLAWKPSKGVRKVARTRIFRKGGGGQRRHLPTDLAASSRAG
jgi:hypothetical protein